jgi:hypothetical protein
VFGALSLTDKLSCGIAILVAQILQSKLEGEDDDDPCGNERCVRMDANIIYVQLLCVTLLCNSGVEDLYVRCLCSYPHYLRQAASACVCT